jgi:TPR repeat protein
MQKGDQYLLEGKIVAARRFYEYAADMGWPDGAAAIARTFDPEHLKKFSILGGIEPNTKLAQEWYDKSRKLVKIIKIDNLKKIGQK